MYVLCSEGKNDKEGIVAQSAGNDSQGERGRVLPSWFIVKDTSSGRETETPLHVLVHRDSERNVKY